MVGLICKLICDETCYCFSSFIQKFDLRMLSMCTREKVVYKNTFFMNNIIKWLFFNKNIDLHVYYFLKGFHNKHIKKYSNIFIFHVVYWIDISTFFYHNFSSLFINIIKMLIYCFIFNSLHCTSISSMPISIFFSPETLLYIKMIFTLYNDLNTCPN